MPNTRKTITALQGIEKHTAALDAQSCVALEFAQLWMLRHFRRKPVPAVVIRRALVLLADHLSNPDADSQPLAELRAFEGVAKGRGTARSLTEARARMEDHLEAPLRQPMASWQDALYSQQERADSRRMLDALEAHMAGRVGASQ